MPSRTRAKRTDDGLEPLLSNLANRMSEAHGGRKGDIHLRCTDLEGDYSLSAKGGLRAGALGKGAATPIVTVAAPSSVVQDVLAGRLDAAQALVGGGVRVRGDLDYLEHLLRDAGLLSCE
jgi:hypothetical protein